MSHVDFDQVYLFLLPLLLSSVLALLRRSPSWRSFLAAFLFLPLSSALYIGLARPAIHGAQLLGTLGFLLIAPVAAVSAVSRMRTFDRMPPLLLVAGPATWLVTSYVGLMVAVGLGIAEP